MIFKSYLIEKNLNNLRTNIVLFYGENLGLKNNLRDAIKTSNKDSEILNFHQEDILKDKEVFFSQLFNISLFSDKKIFFIDQVNDKILESVEEIETRIDNQKIFLFSGLLDKKSKLRNHFEKSNSLALVACYSDNEMTLKKIISEKLKGFTGLNSQNLNMILNNCSLDRSKLDNELDKIIAFFKNKNIREEALETLLNAKENDNFNILKDQALVGSKNKTNKLLSETLLEPEQNIFYLNIINQRLTKLLEIIKMQNTLTIDEAINKIKPPIFWKDKPIFADQAKKWNKNKIEKMLNKTYELELKIKSGLGINKEILIKKLLVDVCNVANSS